MGADVVARANSERVSLASKPDAGQSGPSDGLKRALARKAKGISTSSLALARNILQRKLLHQYQGMFTRGA